MILAANGLLVKDASVDEFKPFLLKKPIHSVLHSNGVSTFIYGLIILNIVALILETNRAVRSSYLLIFQTIEYISIGVFTIEYLTRLWTADLNTEISKLFRSRRAAYFFSFYGFVDLLAIIPFYLPLLIPIDLRIIRILRLGRLFRILKLGRYSKSFKTIRDVLKETKPQLIITIFVALILLVLSTTLMYYAENGAQPEAFSSISDSFWWAVGTLTTVGYGDVYPVTIAGRVLNGIIAFIGIGFVALPTGIISSAFIENLQSKDNGNSSTCAHCGKSIK